MVSEVEGKRTVPPYVSYKTFREFITSLPSGVQEQVDRVVWDSRMGDKTSAQLIASLRFLSLVTMTNEASDTLYELASANSEEKIQILATVVKKHFTPVFPALGEGSREEFELAFAQAFGTTGDTTRKCIAFLLHIAMDARLGISKDILRGRQSSLSMVRQWPPIPREWSSEPQLAESPARTPVAVAMPPEENKAVDRMDPALRGILLSLPEPGPMPGEVKEAWKRALEAVFDLVYPTNGLQYNLR